MKDQYIKKASFSRQVALKISQYSQETHDGA